MTVVVADPWACAVLACPELVAVVELGMKIMESGTATASVPARMGGHGEFLVGTRDRKRLRRRNTVLRTRRAGRLELKTAAALIEKCVGTFVKLIVFPRDGEGGTGCRRRRSNHLDGGGALRTEEGREPIARDAREVDESPDNHRDEDDESDDRDDVRKEAPLGLLLNNGVGGVGKGLLGICVSAISERCYYIFSTCQPPLEIARPVGPSARKRGRDF